MNWNLLFAPIDLTRSSDKWSTAAWRTGVLLPRFQTPKKVAAQKCWGRTSGWGSVGSRRSKASRQRTPQLRHITRYHIIHASLWKKCTKSETRGPVYGFVSYGLMNLEFNRRSLVCFVGGIGEVETSADGPNWGRLKKCFKNRGPKRYDYFGWIKSIHLIKWIVFLNRCNQDGYEMHQNELRHYIFLVLSLHMAVVSPFFSLGPTHVLNPASGAIVGQDFPGC